MGNFAPCPSCRNRSGTWNGSYCTTCHHGTKPTYNGPSTQCDCGAEPQVYFQNAWLCANCYGRKRGPVYGYVKASEEIEKRAKRIAGRR